MIKSVSIEKMFVDLPLYDRFAAVRKFGFHYLEFGLWAPLDISRLRELQQEQQMNIACISGDQDYSIIAPAERNAFLDFLEQSIQVALKLDCRNLYIHSDALGENGKMSTSGEALSDFTKISAATRALMDASVLAEKYGVYLQLEPVSTYVKPGYFMHTTASAGELIRVIDSPNLRLLYDIFHMQMMEGDFTRSVTKYADILGYIHIADTPDRHEPGTGEINFRYFRALLESVGFDGILGFELTPKADINECMKVIHDF